VPDPPCTGDLDRRHWMCTSFTAQFGEMRPRRHFTEPGEGSWEHPTAEWRLPCTERVEIVSGVGTPGGPSRAPLWHLWTTITCAAPPRVPTQHQPKDFDARRRLESRCPGIPCAPRKCTRVFFRLLVGDQPQLLNRAHDAAPGPPSLSSPQPNKSRLNTCHGFFHSAQRCLSRWGPAPTEAVASIGREAAQTGPGRACQRGRITQD